MTVPAVAVTAAAPTLQRARGEGRVVAKQRDGQTEIERLYQEGCAKVRLPHTHSDALQAVLMNTAGGLTGGDRIDWTVEAGAGAKLVITTPACERVYRSNSGDAVVHNRLSAGAGAHIDWLPQETILFEGGRLDRRLEADLADGATLTAVEAVLLGEVGFG